MTISARVTASLAFIQTAAPDGGSARADISAGIVATLANGTADGEADIGFVDDRTLTSGQAEDLDFRGSLLDVYGNTVNAAEITAMVVVADPTNTTNITIKPAASNGFNGPLGAATHTVTLKPGAAVLFFDPAGWAVTANTGDLFNVANAAGASAKYKIALLGRSA